MNLFKSTKAITYISSRGDKVYPIIMDIKTGIVEGDAVFTTGDIDTAYLYATILEEQSDYNILGSTVICNIQRPDGTTMKVQGDVLGNNLIEFPLGQSGVSQEGVYNFDIAVVFSEKKMVTSPTAQYSVTQSIEVIGEIEEDDRFPVLESLISGINVINEEELVRVSNEEVRQSKEEAREQAESVRVRNEETRLANNEAIRNEEAVRVTSENERKNAESLRVQEENKRKQQENTRIAQENTRVSQETARVNAENTRKNQEATRQANEATRVSQETNRNQAESTRNSNETVRQNQENTRKNQEQARVTAEGNRVTSENVRVSAEQARVLKEQERQAIEVERQNSESTREQQEATRVSQENARKQADILRQQDHESRQQFLDGFEGKLNTVVDDVAGIKDDVVAVKEANKRQEVFLQGLYNENLDGRVTVKEEGSVISLTNSDDGLVDVVGLEGNTLVNYVMDGAKELTLNGDIEAEGTNVTLTDIVDNGLVDVACEGNTLVNCIHPLKSKSDFYSFAGTIEDGYFCFTANSSYKNFFIGTDKITVKPSTTYTFVVDIKENTLVSELSKYLTFGESQAGGMQTYWTKSHWITSTEIGRKVFTLTTKDSFDEVKLGDRGFIDANCTSGTVKFRYMILEGDWTDKEIPPYFEGMKSAGECEDNKIEIVSQNKNLFDGELELGSISTSHGGNVTHTECLRSKNYIKVRPNTIIIQSNDLGYVSVIYIYDKDKNLIAYLGSKNPFTIPENGEYIRFRSSTGSSENNLNVKYQFEEGSVATSYVPHSLNKKEISLNEPLRALPNGVCDKIVKIGGKYYVERNCGEVTINGSTPITGYYTRDVNNDMIVPYYSNLNYKAYSYATCDKLPFCKYPEDTYIGKRESISIGSGSPGEGAIFVTIKRENYANSTLQTYLTNNPIKCVVELTAPYYEEITEPTLNTYTDITHISNNSTIPCNMTVKNTGYNAIIKPSTQYTVAFDTDKSGEVGINLGGSKVITNNNVATVTTPSTLVDDTLRLYGKGIKASNIRLLEGDKTNWMPSYFEGMKSSFEDKLQEDGNYNVEILSRNKNLFNGELLKGYTISYITGNYIESENYVSSVDFIPVKPLTHYRVNLLSSVGTCFFVFYDKNKKSLGGSQVWDYKKTPSNCYYMKMYYNKNFIDILTQVEEGTVITDYTPHKLNKIQFPMIEPLRGVGDVKDRFVFNKDGKLMIERNCGSHLLKVRSVNTNYRIALDYPENMRVLESTTENNKCFICNGLKTSNIPVNQNNIDGYLSGVNTISGHSSAVFYSYIFGVTTIESARQWFDENPTKVIYQLKEPTYEEIPFELQKIILEGYLNGTLFFDTNIPPTVEVSYTANIPVVSELNKNSNEIVVTQEDLSVTQVAVDFLLMSNLGEEMLSSFNINTRGRNSMGAYFANRITKGALKYEDVISKYPQYKEEIDSILETK